MSFEQGLMFFNELYLKQAAKRRLFNVWKYFCLVKYISHEKQNPSCNKNKI